VRVRRLNGGSGVGAGACAGAREREGREADRAAAPTAAAEEEERDESDDPARASRDKPCKGFTFDVVALPDVMGFVMDVFNVPIVLDRTTLGSA
jgi:hypothetical protein